MDTIECKICGKRFKMLDKHLHFKHSISVAAYQKKFPVSPIVSESVLKKRNKAVSKGVKKWWNKITPEDKKEWGEKRKQGCMDKYGVSHISYVRSVRRKAEKTLKNNYGDNCYKVLWDKGQPKRTKTMLKRYGVVNPMDNEILATKAVKSHVFPTSPEKLLMREFEEQVNYVGNGQLWVTFKNGRKKNPDLVVKKYPNRVIEVHGDRWHEGEDTSELIRKYREIGYECYVVWEHELKDFSIRFKTLDKIRLFIFESSTTSTPNILKMLG